MTILAIQIERPVNDHSASSQPLNWRLTRPIGAKTDGDIRGNRNRREVVDAITICVELRAESGWIKVDHGSWRRGGKVECTVFARGATIETLGVDSLVTLQYEQRQGGPDQSQEQEWVP